MIIPIWPLIYSSGRDVAVIDTTVAFVVVVAHASILVSSELAMKPADPVPCRLLRRPRRYRRLIYYDRHRLDYVNDIAYDTSHYDRAFIPCVSASFMSPFLFLTSSLRPS